MRARFLLCTALLVAGLGAGRPAAGAGAGSKVKSAIVFIEEPTLIGPTYVHGPVLFTHDARNMARGAPCTSVRLIDPAGGPMEEIAAFHCLPSRGNVVAHFTLTTRPNVSLGFGCVLVAYQFAGDPEVHGVPLTADGH